MEQYYNKILISKDNEQENKDNYHWGYKNDKYNYENFKKKASNRSETQFKYTYDINNPTIKEYMINNPNKFKTMCICNIFLSKIIQGKEFVIFLKNEYDNLFKEYFITYIDNDKLNMRLLNFDNYYNEIFKNCNLKHRKSQKCKLKKEYKKYLYCGDIEKCNLKDLLYMFIAYVSLVEKI